MTDELRDRLIGVIRRSPRLSHALAEARALALPDWRITSGAIYQAVWNSLTGRPDDYGLKDYDLFYFDPDPSWEAEDRIIKRAAARLPAPLDTLVEIRNQARVHLWFETRFGEPYAPLACTDEAVERFVAPCFAVGVRLEEDDSISVVAPFGLEDLFGLRLRPNPRRAINRQGFERVAALVAARWPEVQVVD